MSPLPAPPRGGAQCSSVWIFRFPPADYLPWKSVVGAKAAVGHLPLHLLILTFCPVKVVIVGLYAFFLIGCLC